MVGTRIWHHHINNSNCDVQKENAGGISKVEKQKTQKYMFPGLRTTSD